MTNFPKETMQRKIMFVENRLRKEQINEICKRIASIEGDKTLDNDIDAIIHLKSLKKLKKSQLTSWRQFRTKNGLSNDVLINA